MLRAALFLPAILLSACATVVNGSHQTVTLSTAPPGATCTVDRMGARVGVVAQTPGSVRLAKSKNDLTVTCSKPGYQTAAVTRAPSFGAATFGNVLVGGVVGVVVDAASGANYAYPADIRLNMAAIAVPPPVAPPLAALPMPAPDRVADATGPAPVRLRRPRSQRQAEPRVEPITAVPVTF